MWVQVCGIQAANRKIGIALIQKQVMPLPASKVEWSSSFIISLVDFCIVVQQCNYTLKILGGRERGREGGREGGRKSKLVNTKMTFRIACTCHLVVAILTSNMEGSVTVNILCKTKPNTKHSKYTSDEQSL